MHILMRVTVRASCSNLHIYRSFERRILPTLVDSFISLHQQNHLIKVIIFYPDSSHHSTTTFFLLFNLMIFAALINRVFFSACPMLYTGSSKLFNCFFFLQVWAPVFCITINFRFAHQFTTFFILILHSDFSCGICSVFNISK